MLRRAEVLAWKQSTKSLRLLGGVSVAIVLRRRKSRLQGEGPQRSRGFRCNLTECEPEESLWMSLKCKRNLVDGQNKIGIVVLTIYIICSMMRSGSEHASRPLSQAACRAIPATAECAVVHCVPGVPLRHSGVRLAEFHGVS